MDILEPRDYQSEDLEPLVKAGHTSDRCLNLIYGTGGGKTPVALICTTLWFRHRVFKHILVISPQVMILDQWCRYANRKFRFQGTHTIPRINIKNGQALDRFFCQKEPNHFAVTTYEVLRNIADRLCDLVRRGLLDPHDVLIIIDEGHHVSTAVEANQLSTVVQGRLVPLGIRTLKLTATGYRSDGRPVVNEGDFTIRRSLVDLIIRGACPTKILSQVVQVSGEGLSIGSKLNHTLGVPVEIQSGAKVAADLWVADGCLPTMIRVKPRREDDNNHAVRLFTESFERAKATVIDATGPSPTDFFEALKIEQMDKPPYKDLVDVFLAIHRMTEGVDSPSRCCGYLWGVPSSMLVLEQVLGRLLRLRRRYDTKEPLYAGYPELWLDQSKLVFFVAGVKNASFDHSRLLLQSTLFIDAFQDADLVRQLFAFQDGLGVKRFPRSKELAEALDPEKLAAARQVLKGSVAFWEHSCTAYDKNLSVAKQLELARFWADTNQIEVEDKFLSRALFLEQARKRGDLRRKMQDHITAALHRGALPDEAFLRAQDLLLDEFRNETLACDSSLVHHLFGDTFSWWSGRLARSYKSVSTSQPKSPQEILEGVDAHLQQSGGFPNLQDEDPLRPLWSFQSYHRLLNKGQVGIPQLDGGLPQLIVNERGTTPWFEMARWVLEDFKGRRESQVLSVTTEASGEKVSALRRVYRDVPEAVYFTRAIVALGLYPEIAEQLSLREAELLGRLPKVRRRYVRRLVTMQGIGELKSRLSDGSIYQLGRST